MYKGDYKGGKRFAPPTLAQVHDEIVQKKYIVDAVTFWNYYESNGWRVGKNQMKSWKAALARWNSEELKKPSGNPFTDMLRREGLR